MSKSLALEVADKAAPFLLHPNSAILTPFFRTGPTFVPQI